MTKWEPFNLEFSENCIIIIDPSIQIHNEAYAIIEFKDDLYFRQYIEKEGNKLLRCINTNYDDIKLDEEFEVRMNIQLNGPNGERGWGQSMMKVYR